MRRLRLLPRLLALCGLLAAGAGPAAPQDAAPGQGPPDTFREDLTVREVELVVELPPGRAGLRPEELEVLVEGEPRPLPVARAEPIGGDANPWSILLYFDRALAGPDAVHSAALALARHAETLAGLGAVEVAVADPEPRVVLASVRGAFPAAQALADLAGETRRASGQVGAPPAPDPPVVRRQADALIAFLAARPVRGPRVLLLVADGMELPPGAVSALEAGAAGPVPGGTGSTAPPPAGTAAPSGPAAAYLDAARALAAYGWTTLALPMRPAPLDPEPVERTDQDRFRKAAGWDDDSEAFISFIPLIRKLLGLRVRREPTPEERTLEVVPRLAPLRALAEATGGELIGYESQLGPALADLRRRWNLFYPSPDPLDGRVRPVTVRMANGGPALAAPAWVRSSIPLVVTEARLRRLLAVSQADEATAAATDPTARNLLRGDLPLTASLSGTGERTLRLSLPAGAAPAGPVRAALAFGSGPEIRHETLAAAGPDAGSWSQTLTLPAGTGPVAVIVEDLARERWAGRVLDPG